MESPIKRVREMKKVRSVPELNNLEHINAQLKGKVKVLAVEMKDAMERMTTMTVEMNSIKNENMSCKDRLVELEQENALLVSQVEEMANERAERDAIIEEFSTAVEARIIEWKEILDEKDSMIAKLKENLMYAASDRAANASPEEKSSTEIERLIQDIDRRDEIIAELQTKLSEAVIEINESSLLIEKFKSDSRPQGVSKKSTKEQRVEDTIKKIRTLETLLERAEKDAKVKSEQLCEALAILNKYEDEDSSLADALEEIKDLKIQLVKKNKHIEDLVDVINRLEVDNSRYEEIIIILRDKVEDVEGDDFSLDNLLLERQKTQEEKDEKMQRNYDELASENVDLKFQIRKLKTALKESLKNKLNKTNGVVSDGEHGGRDLSHRSESKKSHLELKRIREHVKWVIDENEALRQGMHEILDSIHNHDGKSIVTIQSQTLENLLEALDARHLAGWYHPAMRLQGRVNYLQGSNAELRAQLQQIRQNQMLHEADALQRSSSVEEGEYRQTRSSLQNITPDVKTADLPMTPSASRNVTPKSSRSMHSLKTDSGRASGKATESDDLLQAETPENGVASESLGDTPMNDNDEVFGKKSEEIYAMAKEIVAQESDFKEALNESERRQRELEARIITLRKNLANFIAPEVYAELRQKYLESNMHLRAMFEDKLAMSISSDDGKGVEAVKAQVMCEARNELLELHKRLSEVTANSTTRNIADVKTLSELENRITELKLENEKLQRSAEIARDEAQKHRAIDSTVLAEFNELRRRVLRIEADSEDGDVKETARLALELANYKVIETELREQKKTLERDLTRAREELADLRRRRESDGEICQEGRKQLDNREYVEIIDFLQQQYAGSTSLSAYERYEANLNKLNNERNEVKELVAKIHDQNESLRIQHETLTSRLQIVEQLKDMLEQQIGSNEVQDIMKKFTDDSKTILAESKYKMQINQLEEESRNTKKNLRDYEIKVAAMEREIIRAQKAWQVQKISNAKVSVTNDKATETNVNMERKKIVSSENTIEKSTQTELKVQTIETQCSLCCKSETNDRTMEIEKDSIHETESSVSQENDETAEKTASIALLQEQLGQALNLASKRSVALSKSESQLVELRAKIIGLTKLLDERQLLPSTIHVKTAFEPTKDETGHFCMATSQEALQSTIKTLEKIVAQKEETIARYQALLKEDRDKHSEAAARLQNEIKSLKKRIVEPRGTQSFDNDMNAQSEQPERDLSVGENDGRTTEVEETSILREKISRLETELGISAELAERWHRLAEDRLRHMDSMRERLEEQHKEEIESYRKEFNKRQQEINELRRQISENRRAPTTKTEVLSFMKALQIKDNRLADEIENELEKHANIASKPQQQQQQQQRSSTYIVEDSRLLEIEQSQSQLDNLRKQLKACMERERSYRNEIAELQQQLSRRHMAVKAQEKKTSRREMQLERKVKELEEELHEAKELLDRHFMVQQAKRAKTAEDLGLWEKLKKWQQTAEKLKEKLKEKTDECQRLQGNYEKLRNLIACMEREKLFLRERKYRSESASVTPPTSADVIVNKNNQALVEELRAECHELRCRVKELLGKLNVRDCEICEERKISVPVAFEDDEFVNVKTKRLREMQELLEKENLRLEAENFEFRLELERANVNLPRYEEKIQHLEKYIELLKTEKSLEALPRREGPQRSKSELERTVVTLKNLVEKLQQENKRLRNSVIQTDLDTQCSCLFLRGEYKEAKHRIAFLETELELAQRRIALITETADTNGDKSSEEVSELALLREQLGRKSEVLLKVKDLLAKATANEKALRQRIQQLEFKQTLSAIPECESSQAIS